MSCTRPPFIISTRADQEFVNRVNHAADGLQVVCTSYFRTQAENLRVGGDPFSQHLVGWAIDATGKDLPTFKRRAQLAGLTVVSEATHAHVQLFPAGILRRLFG